MSYPLIDLVESLGEPHVLVVGDLILDRYTWGNAERISQEAPVMLLAEERQEVRLGGAANVANMLRGLDARVSIAGAIGADADGEVLLAELAARGIGVDAVLKESQRPTTVKERIIGHAQHRHPHQILRIDRESREPLGTTATTQLLDRVLPRLNQFDAILISDYAKGVCTDEITQRIIEFCRALGKPVIVDPAPKVNYRRYLRATAMTPNRLETQLASGIEVTNTARALEAGTRLVRDLQLDHIFVTLDRDGIAVVQANGSAEIYPTRTRDVYDITGAGDMVLATIGVGAAAGASTADLARLANVAGGLEVEQVGVVCISRDEMIQDLLLHGRHSNRVEQKVCTLPVLQRHLRARRKAGQKIVLTNGCFDVMHIGHATYLQQAAALGQCLVVAMNSDDSVRTLGKGPDRPIFPQQQRAAMLSMLEAVDYVVTFDESTPHELLRAIQPDILVKGGTYRPEEVVGREIVLAYGGSVRVLSEVPGVSSTEILQRLRGGGVASDTVPLRKAG